MAVIDLQGYQEYLHERELSPSTVLQYIGALRMYANDYGDVTPSTLIDYKSKLIGQYATTTVNVRLSAIRGYCSYAGIPYTVRRVKVQRTSHIENIITMEQYQQLMNGLEQDGLERWIVNIKMISMTGARISEALRVTKNDVLRGYAVMPTKGKVRTIQIPHGLAAELAGYIKPLADNDVIIQSRFGSPMSRQSYSKVLKSFSRYGIPKSVLHPHSFRHFFAIEFLRRNNNISLLADILGHSSVNTTMIYLRMSQDEQKRAIDEAVDW